MQNLAEGAEKDFNIITQGGTLDIIPNNPFELAAYYSLLIINIAVLIMIVR